MKTKYSVTINNINATIITALCDVMNTWNANIVVSENNIVGQTRYGTLTEEDAIMEATTMAKAALSRSFLSTIDELDWEMQTRQCDSTEAAIEQDNEGTCEGWDKTREWQEGNITMREWRSDRNHLSISAIGADEEANEKAAQAAFDKIMNQ
jgi:hypothetical protein